MFSIFLPIGISVGNPFSLTPSISSLKRQIFQVFSFYFHWCYFRLCLLRTIYTLLLNKNKNYRFFRVNFYFNRTKAKKSRSKKKKKTLFIRLKQKTAKEEGKISIKFYWSTWNRLNGDRHIWRQKEQNEDEKKIIQISFPTQFQQFSIAERWE